MTLLASKAHSNVFVGIDVGGARKGFDLVAIDCDRRVVAAHRHLGLERTVEIVCREIQPDIVCIDSPSQWASRSQRRAAETALTRIGLNLFTTPGIEKATSFHDWMRQGFALFHSLSEAGYPTFDGGPTLQGTAAEYFPHASASLLDGSIPQLRDKLSVRRSLLERHGVVGVGSLVGIDQVDAGIGALTGLLALAAPKPSFVGDSHGAILLPTPLPLHRLPRLESSNEAPATRTNRKAHRACACGCGREGPGEFRPGHDAKHLSALRRRSKAGDIEAATELQRRNWRVG